MWKRILFPNQVGCKLFQNMLASLYIHLHLNLSDAFIQSDLQCIQAIHFCHYMCSLGIEPTTFCTANAMLYHWATGTVYRVYIGPLLYILYQIWRSLVEDTPNVCVCVCVYIYIHMKSSFPKRYKSILIVFMKMTFFYLDPYILLIFNLSC